MNEIYHVGIRPTYELVIQPSDAPFEFYEKHPDGKIRFWNKRMLLSGCNQKIEEIKIRDELIYCECCDEWFAPEQFAEYINDKT